MSMNKGILACFLCCFAHLLSEDCNKSGCDPCQSPLEIKSADSFLPYNPTVVLVGCDNLRQIKEVMEMREQSVVYCFARNKKKTARLQRETKELDHVHIVDLSTVAAKHQEAAFVKWCAKQNISKIDLLTIDRDGKEKAFLKTAAKIVKEATVVFVTTPPKDFNKMSQLMASCEFVLLSHWKNKKKDKGRACFVKVAYYRGVYERKFI